jgi:hypothetical protein
MSKSIIVLGVIFIVIGVILLLISVKKPTLKAIKEGSFFLLGFGLAFLLLYIIIGSGSKYGSENENSFQVWGVYIAVFTAIGTTIISIWQSYETRLANRKAVFPYLNVNRDSFTHVDKPSITISNTGVGPAKINDIFIYIGNERIEGDDNNERFKKFFSYAMTHGFSGKLGTTLSCGTFIQVSQTFTLFEVDKSKIKPGELKECEEFFKSISIEMCYADIYGKQFEGHVVFD